MDTTENHDPGLKLPASPYCLFCDELTRLLGMQQEAIATLKLIAYAVDAMRVLMLLEQHANMSTTVDEMLKSVCSDWRNPGSVEHPADLITVVLAQAVGTLHQTHGAMEQTLAAIH